MGRWICAAAAIVLALVGAAHATWSIILVDTRTGEVALGSATCLTAFDLQAGTPVLLTGIGGATAQSFVDTTSQNRTFIRDQLLLGTHPEMILELLADFDPGHQTRQYGIADAMGGTATFSGTGAGDWKGGVTGQVGDIVYAIQGNVLTGAPVVLMAEQAVINTEGDLAAKLMAGMEAARSMGGDGRCSCSPQNPEGCGSPPPNFDKSAHIAYMLIARTGDLDVCNASYPGGLQPWAIGSGDFNADGLADIAIVDRPGEQIAVLLNESPPGLNAVVLSPPTMYPVDAEMRDIAVGDVNEDGALDLVYAITGTSQVGIRLGVGNGTFGAQMAISASDEPERVELLDVNSDGDLDIVAVVSDGVLVAFGDGTGGFDDAVTIGVTSPTAAAAGDLDGDGDVDIAVTDADLDAVLVFTNSGGSFGLATFEFVGSSPADVAATDLDNDGDVDLAIANNSDSSVTVLLKNDGGLSYTPAEYATWFGPARFAVQDLDADGLTDLVVMHNPNRFTMMRGAGAGTFVVENDYPTLGNNGDMTLADLDGDGDLDVAMATRVPGTVYTVQNFGAGVYNEQLGCGGGDHFMQFNIAFQTQQDPDPVFQLQELFDQWRADLVGRPDAVQTLALFDPVEIPGDSTSTTTLTITPLDWQGLAASIDSVTIEHATGSDVLGDIGEVTDNGDGTFSVVVTAGIKPGMDLFRVTLDDGVRPVILMPPPALEYTINIDFNGDGSLNVLDFVAFQAAFQKGSESADVDADGELTILDFIAFTQAFQDG